MQIVSGRWVFNINIIKPYFTHPHLKNDGRWLPRFHRRGHRRGMAALSVCHCQAQLAHGVSGEENA
jgi:hypothetical protein